VRAEEIEGNVSIDTHRQHQVILANEPLSEFLAQKYISFLSSRSAASNFEVWALGPSTLTAPSLALIPMTQTLQDLRELETRLGKLGSDDAIFLADGYRKHERANFSTIHKLLRVCKASKNVVVFDENEIIRTSTQTKIKTIGRNPYIGILLIKQWRLVLRNFFIGRLKPQLTTNKGLFLDTIYCYHNFNSVDERLIQSSTKLHSVTRAKPSKPSSYSVGKSLNPATARTKRVIVIDPGFWLHAPDEKPNYKLFDPLPNDAAKTSRQLMLPALNEISNTFGASCRITICLHPNRVSLEIKNPYEPYEHATKSTEEMLELAEVAVSFGSALTRFAAGIVPKIVLVDTAEDYRTSLSVHALHESIEHSDLWIYQMQRGYCRGIRKIPSLHTYL
jgi:hypothetical protein